MLKNWMKTILLIVFCAFLDMSVANATTTDNGQYLDGINYSRTSISKNILNNQLGGLIFDIEYNNYESNYISCGNGMISDVSTKVPSITRTIYFVIEILVPIVLVIIGSIDLVKGVIGGNDDEIKKGQKTFVKRLITACIVFFVLALVKLIVSFFGPTNKDNIINCMDCFLNSKDSCTKMVIDEERLTIKSQ